METHTQKSLTQMKLRSSLWKREKRVAKKYFFVFINFGGNQV